MGYNLCPHRHSALDGHPRLLRAAPQARASHTPQLRWPDPHHRPAEPGIERSLPLNTSRVKTRHSRALSHTHTHTVTHLFQAAQPGMPCSPPGAAASPPPVSRKAAHGRPRRTRTGVWDAHAGAALRHGGGAVQGVLVLVQDGRHGPARPERGALS